MQAEDGALAYRSLQEFPAEVLDHIFAYLLHPSDLLTCGRVCR